MEKSTLLLIGWSILASSLGQGLPAAPEVAEWQTYRNAKYGYEIRYPDGFDLWPTGPAGERDGRAIRIGRKEYSAPAPVLDIFMQAGMPCVESPVDVELARMDVTVGDVEINGARGREVTYRWKVSGDIASVNLCLRDVLLRFDAQPGLRDFHATVWWTIVSTFRLQDE